jgi:hypothetical protein
MKVVGAYGVGNEERWEDHVDRARDNGVVVRLSELVPWERVRETEGGIGQGKGYYEQEGGEIPAFTEKETGENMENTDQKPMVSGCAIEYCSMCPKFASRNMFASSERANETPLAASNLKVQQLFNKDWIHDTEHNTNHAGSRIRVPSSTYSLQV